MTARGARHGLQAQTSPWKLEGEKRANQLTVDVNEHNMLAIVFNFTQFPVWWIDLID